MCPEGHTAQYAYNSIGQLIVKTAPTGGQTRYQYDDQARLSHIISPEGVIQQLGYDSLGRLHTVSDVEGNTTTFERDNNDRLIKITDPLGHSLHFTYNYQDKLTHFTDANGNVTRWVYDDVGYLVEYLDAQGHKTTYKNNKEGEMWQTTNPRRQHTQFRRDPLNRVYLISNTQGHAEQLTFDPAGNVLSYQHPKPDWAWENITEYTYDENNNLISQNNQLGDTTTFTYDALNRIIAMQDPLGQVTEFSYDNLSNLVNSIDALGGNSSQQFDGNGNRTALTEPNGNTTQFAYDQDDRLIRTTLASGDSVNYTYNARGLLATLTNAQGQVRTFEYDAAGNLSGFSDTDGAVQFQYDANSNLTQTSDAVGAIQRTYDALNRVQSYTDAAGNTLWFHYDAVGNLTELVYPDGRSVYYTYDGLNRLTQIWDLASKKTTYTYDRKNRLTSIQHHNGTQQHRDYNAAGQLTELQELDINGHIIVSYQFSYDAAGNIVQEAVTPDITQLTDSLPLMDYGFANRLGSVDGQAAEFDGDGNMVKAPNGETLRFDTRNRLVEYGGIEYVFNAENHRVGMRTAEGLTQYVVNPVPALSQTLVKTAPDGSQTYYVYGLGLVSEHGANGYRTYHYDLRGSTVALSDEQGVVVERFVYSPFGGLVSGDVSATPFLYNGRDGVITDANGLYHMRARFYSPELRRFVNQDVLLGFVAEGQTLNRYAYVTGNPVSFIDPFGLAGLTATETWLLRGAGGLTCIFPVPGARVAGLGLIMLTLSGDTSNKQTLRGEGIAPPGDCNQGYYEYLRQQKELACNQPRACSAHARGNCNDILLKLDLNNACIKARNDVMNQCFRGGDKKHQVERERARKTAFSCIEQAARNSCPGF